MAFTESEINSFLDVIGEIVPVGPIEWGMVVDRHRVAFPNRNRDMISLRRKFNAIANMTPPTGDPEVPAYIQKAKDIQRAIEVKMDSGPVTMNDVGIEEPPSEAGADGLDDGLDDALFSADEDDIINGSGGDGNAADGVRNNTPQEGARERRAAVRAYRLPPGLNQPLMVPQPQQPQVPQYQNLLASANIGVGGVSRPPFVAPRSSQKMTMEDYYTTMMMNRMERRELEDNEREHHQVEREERLLIMDLERREREQKMEHERRERERERLEREREREEERKERAEERKNQRDFMNLLMVQIMGNLSQSPSKSKEKKSND